MFNIGSNASHIGASSKHGLSGWPMAILFAGLALNLVWIVTLAWLAIRIAFRLLMG